MTAIRHRPERSAPTEADRAKLARVRDERATPKPGTSLATDRMLHAIAVFVSHGHGDRRDVAKMAEWMRCFPLRTASEVHEWRSWGPETIGDIADAVLTRGWTPERTAMHHRTTPATVTEIVAHWKNQTMRGASS